MSFPNTIYGDAGDQHVHTDTQRCPLGTRLVLADGRVFRYCENGGTDLVAGTQLQAEVPAEDLATFSHTLQAGAAAGATSIRINGSGDTEPVPYGDFDEGYAWYSATGAAGRAECHQIESFLNFAGSTSAESAIVVASTSPKSAMITATGSVVEVYLKRGDSLQAAWLTSTGVVRLTKNPYKEVIVRPAVTTQIPIGVANNAIDADYFFWAQTWGPCPILFDEGTQDLKTRGIAICPSTEDAGAVRSAVGATDASEETATAHGGEFLPQIGYLMEAVADTFQGLVFLTIAP